MQNPRKEPPRLTALRLKYRNRFDAVAMLIYLVVVYGWFLGIRPLGRDYAVLADGGAGMPFLAKTVFAWEMQVFGGWTGGYHLVNLALLYVAMICAYWFANYTLKGLWWMGTLTASLFMANPVHTEAVLNVSGVGDLLPFVIALGALTAYAAHAFEPRGPKFVVALLLFALAVAPYRANAYLGLVLVLYECLITDPEHRRLRRVVPFLAINIAAACWQGPALFAQGFSPARSFVPLYFMIYPVGFLPETARRFYEYPLLAWAAAAAAVFIVALIYRNARRPSILFGLLAMLAVRLYSGERVIDPVHLIGGGQLLLANLLFTVALVGLFFRIMENAKWRAPMIGLTTTLCIVAFAMQIRENRIWLVAGRDVGAFQEQVSQAIADHPHDRVGVCPDYQYRLGTPMCLSESVRYDTPFSKALPVASVLPLHHPGDGELKVSLEDWTSEGGSVRVSGRRIANMAPWPYALARMRITSEADASSMDFLLRVFRRDNLPRSPVETGAGLAELAGQDDEGFTISVDPREGETLPEILVPGATPTEDQRGKNPISTPSPTLENRRIEVQKSTSVRICRRPTKGTAPYPMP